MHRKNKNKTRKIVIIEILVYLLLSLFVSNIVLLTIIFWLVYEPSIIWSEYHDNIVKSRWFKLLSNKFRKTREKNIDFKKFHSIDLKDELVECPNSEIVKLEDSLIDDNSDFLDITSKKENYISLLELVDKYQRLVNNETNYIPTNESSDTLDSGGYVYMKK